MDLSRMNQFDIAVAHGRALRALGWGFDTISDERLADVDLHAYAVVIWAAGEESTANETFSHAQQDFLRAYVESGGHLVVSGAEILWDLDERGDAQDQAFAEQVLGASLADDNSGSTQVTGSGILAGLILDFAEADGAPYPVEFPDVLSADGEPLAHYGNGGLAGVLTGNVALFGFPLETIGSELARTEAMGAVLQALLPDYEVPVDSGGGSDTGESGEKDRKGACSCSATDRVSTSWWPLLFGVWVGVKRRKAASFIG
jgi:hypothetical protein